MAQAAPTFFRVLGIPPITKEYHLINYFSKFGQVLNVYIPRESQTLQHKGIGFVQILEDSAYKTIMEQKYHVELGIKVRVMPPPDSPIAMPSPIPNIKLTKPRYFFTKLEASGARHMHTTNPDTINFHGFTGWLDNNPTTPSIPRRPVYAYTGPAQDAQDAASSTQDITASAQGDASSSHNIMASTPSGALDDASNSTHEFTVSATQGDATGSTHDTMASTQEAASSTHDNATSSAQEITPSGAQDDAIGTQDTHELLTNIAQNIAAKERAGTQRGTQESTRDPSHENTTKFANSQTKNEILDNMLPKSEGLEIKTPT